MGVLLHHQIIDAIKAKKITYSLDTFDNVGPNSVDVTIHNVLKTYIPCKIIEIIYQGHPYKKIIKNDEISDDNFFVDMSKPNKTYTYEIPNDGLILSPEILYLGSTNEVCGSKWFVPIYEGRSSIARLGLQSHISAGFGDINFEARWTLEIVCIHPFRIFPNARIGQVYFVSTDEAARDKLYADNKFYQSKYNEQTEAQASMSHLDFVDGVFKSRK